RFRLVLETAGRVIVRGADGMKNLITGIVRIFRPEARGDVTAPPAIHTPVRGAHRGLAVCLSPAVACAPIGVLALGPEEFDRPRAHVAPAIAVGAPCVGGAPAAISHRAAPPVRSPRVVDAGDSNAGCHEFSFALVLNSPGGDLVASA